MFEELVTSAFDYPLPQHLIAQRPLPDRGASRLLVVHRASGRREHRQFHDFPSLVAPGDVVVVNASRVIPARLAGWRENGRPAEVLLIRPEPDGSWVAMVHPGGKLKVGKRVRFGTAEWQGGRVAGMAEVEMVEVMGGGLRRVCFHGMEAGEVMARWGAVPLPPYIRRAPEPADRDRYQTVYAITEGSVAAPTAGLHFTEATLDAVRARGATIAQVLLHVGPGTFKPVEAEDPAAHLMHAEWYEVSPAAAQAVNAAKAGGGRVWAVGTTAVRVLETAAAAHAELQAVSGWTDLFIRPPYDFKTTDALLTNFHLPRSTLLMLVAAFAGYEATMAAYREAIAQEYRLYSYGDAMVIL